eukprot:scaffold111488_cov19-Tisochrysis_lutea.AAC.1
MICNALSIQDAGACSSPMALVAFSCNGRGQKIFGQDKANSEAHLVANAVGGVGLQCLPVAAKDGCVVEFSMHTHMICPYRRRHGFRSTVGVHIMSIMDARLLFMCIKLRSVRVASKVCTFELRRPSDCYMDTLSLGSNAT